MRKNIKKTWPLILVAILLVIALGIYLFFQLQTSLLTPIKELKKVMPTLTEANQKKLNQNLMEAYYPYYLREENLTYLSSSNRLENNQYQGRLVDNNGYTYQFSINIATEEVKVWQIPKRQIDEEELASDDTNFNPEQR